MGLGETLKDDLPSIWHRQTLAYEHQVSSGLLAEVSAGAWYTERPRRKSTSARDGLAKHGFGRPTEKDELALLGASCGKAAKTRLCGRRKDGKPLGVKVLIGGLRSGLQTSEGRQCQRQRTPGGGGGGWKSHHRELGKMQPVAVAPRWRNRDQQHRFSDWSVALGVRRDCCPRVLASRLPTLNAADSGPSKQPRMADATVGELPSGSTTSWNSTRIAAPCSRKPTFAKPWRKPKPPNDRVAQAPNSCIAAPRRVWLGSSPVPHLWAEMCHEGI